MPTARPHKQAPTTKEPIRVQALPRVLDHEMAASIGHKPLSIARPKGHNVPTGVRSAKAPPSGALHVPCMALITRIRRPTVRLQDASLRTIKIPPLTTTALIPCQLLARIELSDRAIRITGTPQSRLRGIPTCLSRPLARRCSRHHRLVRGTRNTVPSLPDVAR